MASNILTPTKINNVQSSDFHSVYSNNVSIIMSFFDLYMTFGEVRNLNPEDGMLTVDQKVRVALAVTHAKVLFLALAQQIQQYEAKFGQIHLPDEVLTPELKAFLPHSNEG